MDKDDAIRFRYVIYCPRCHEIIREELKKRNVARCWSPCGIDLGPNFLEKNNGRFVVISIKEQIQNYLRYGHFQSIVRVFHFAKHGRFKGPIHDVLSKGLHLSLTLFYDAASLTRDNATSLLPAALFFNDIPVHLRHRYIQYPLYSSLLFERHTRGIIIVTVMTYELKKFL